MNKDTKTMQTLDILSTPNVALRRESGPKALLVSVLNMLYIWHERAKNRKILAGLDDRLLNDIGINAVKRDRECAKPFWKA